MTTAASAIDTPAGWATLSAGPLRAERLASFDRALACVAAVVLMGAAVWLRAWRLDSTPALNGDEAWYGALACDALAGRDVPWRTPTGNLLNPFFFAPQVIVHAVLDPSPAAVRLTALASGLLALAVNFLLARRTLGFTAAAGSTLLLAVLPTNIAYSRFGWDASQTLLFTVLVCHASLRLATSATSIRRGAVWCSLALGAACLVHPTNVFLVGLPVAALIARHRELRLKWRAALATPKRRTVAAIVGLVAISASLIASDRLRERVLVAAQRSCVLEQYPLFARNVLRLFSGLSVYRYIPGSQSAADEEIANSWRDVCGYDLASAAALVLFIVAWRAASRRGVAVSREDRVLLGGYGSALLLFFWFAGPEAIEPHYERYGLCLIAPAALLLGRCLERGATAWPARRGGGFVLLMACGIAWLADFQRNYFDHFAATGGTSHATFRTGEADPKWLAVRQATAGASAEAPVTIVASEWWNYWPARYYAGKMAGVRVLWWQEMAVSDTQPGRLCADQCSIQPPVWLMEFADSDVARQQRAWLASQGIAFDEWQFGDVMGAPVVALLQLKRSAIEAPPRGAEFSESTR